MRERRRKSSAVWCSGRIPVAQKPIANTTRLAARIPSLPRLPVGGMAYTMAALIKIRMAANPFVLLTMKKSSAR
jgi:hypothetical protein